MPDGANAVHADVMSVAEVRGEIAEPKKLRVGRQFRYAQMQMPATKLDGRTMPVSFSSETPVQRFFGTEVLVHDPASARMSRINAGAPLLFNHNRDDVVGIVDPGSASIGADRHGHASVTFFDTARGNEVRSMVDQGLRNVSFAYDIHAVRELADGAGYDVTDWEPTEISIVSVPADFSVGVGRDSADVAHDVAIEKAAERPPPTPETPETEAAQAAFSLAAAPAQAAVGTTAVRDAAQPTAKPAATQTGVVTMPDVANAPAGAPADSQDNTRISAVEAEKQRTQAIRNLCAANRIDDRVETAWIQRGTPLTEVAEELLAVMEQRGKERPAIAAEIGMSSSETKRYSLFRAIRAMHFGGKNPEFIRQAAFELECSAAVSKKVGRDTSGVLIPSEILTRPLGLDERQQRAMSVVPGTKGGFMVNVENMGFIDILRNRSVCMRMGARVISGLQGNVFFPRQTGKVTVTWQAGEGTSVTAADQALGQLSMTPKTCVAITDVSEQLLRQASPSAEAFVMADLAADVAIDGVDAAAINGTGGAQPLGIKNTTGITSGQDAASATYAKVLAFVSTAGGANAIRGNPGWVTNTAGAARLMQVQRFTSTDTPVWEGNMLDGTLVGFNAMSSEQLASGNLVFGSWDELVIGEWGVLELSTDNGGTRFNQLQIGIRATWMVDVLTRYPQAFVVSTNLS